MLPNIISKELHVLYKLHTILFFADKTILKIGHALTTVSIFNVKLHFFQNVSIKSMHVRFLELFYQQKTE
jgi:hypothetical protein